MATLVLTTVGTLLGGPVGGAIGALAGRTLDGALIGGGKREGARLKELAITTSSYGQPIPRHHGRMRAGGTIVWATDLVEHKTKSGGKKGQPSVTSYSYTTSFAVVISSRPIRGVGRIWADGNLLRGTQGDLKAAGNLRVLTGEGDQAPDPLIVADKGAASCPAFRGCAYVVFEDLALENFGNRIPALSFEIIADEGAITLGDIVDPLDTDGAATSVLSPLAGFAVDGGPMAATLATVDTLFPLACDAGGERLSIKAEGEGGSQPRLLPPAVRGWDEGDFGPADGERLNRVTLNGNRPDAVRYYDVARDYQPGVQRPAGRAGTGPGRTIEFPGSLAADDARSLTEAVVRRAGWDRDRVQWRVAELDPALAPGTEVRVPGRTGVWRVDGWEWRSRGIELDLVRRSPLAAGPASGDPGDMPRPPDMLSGPTSLHAFEVPAAGTAAEERTLFAAATSAERGWAGAALFVDRAGKLLPIGSTGRVRATLGKVVRPIGSSPGLHLEAAGTIELALVDPDGRFDPATIAAIAQGANRLLVGEEVLQFLDARKTVSGSWVLSGLLRGRGGTEPAALRGHPTGTTAVLLDDAIVALDPAVLADPSTTIAAIGLGDPEPVLAPLANAGLSRRPPSPVHPRVSGSIDTGLVLGWTRRARGSWHWLDGVDAPLVEQAEQYRVGLGPVDAPLAEWVVAQPAATIPGDVLAPLASAHPGVALWVRQVGSFSLSDPLFLTRLP
ncbi:phage tail protein [Tsuneonella sp. SYSU-LHT278]|uniref:phage tail protein n=1 Tax=Tsuneonella sediminis TaxID=3416089 RepID=UPI003F796BDF